MFKFITLKFFFPLVSLLCCAISTQAAEYVISDEGKHIQLNDDGTWAQVSQDRYATTRDGKRIRLRPDGSWAVVRDNAAQPESELTYNGQSIPVQSVDDLKDVVISLDKVEVLKVKAKLAKSTRLDTRTVFHLRVKGNVDASIVQNETLKAGIRAYSSSGQTFTIKRISRHEANGYTTLTLVGDGSPRWMGVKYLSVAIEQNVLGNRSKRILSKNMDDVIMRKVKMFKE